MTGPAGLENLETQAAALQRAHGVRSKRLICDAHAGYSSTRWARTQPRFTKTLVSHHHAHASALAGEYPEVPHWLCFTWDAAGMAPDGTLWGGGGAARTTRRLGACRDVPAIFSTRRGEGRARTLGLRRRAGLGHGLAVRPARRTIAGPAAAVPPRGWRAANGLGAAGAHAYGFRALHAARAYAFHASLAATLVAQAAALRDSGQVFAVGLCGGVFQNRLLTALALEGLHRAGLRAVLPVRHACHDGALSFGQVIEAAAA